MSETPDSLFKRFSVRRVSESGSERIVDTVATEEPLEIRVRYSFKDASRIESLAVTMRTPGDDLELAAGLLVAEGLVKQRGDLISLRSLGAEPSQEVQADLSPSIDFEAWRTARISFVSSACGVCGKRTREAIEAQTPGLHDADFSIRAAVLEKIPEQLRAVQQGFAQTGGLHAAALVNGDGHIERMFEDIGRHNALDKVVGWRLLHGRFPLSDSFLFLSSRSSFELIQKAAMAHTPMLATVGGPSSLAIEAARQYGITLVGFVRERRFNVYAGEWRIHS